eukprot:gb/GEZN01005915.1/.p1 GENE.gb/GEZN01005915.1/~~gb/GEZN01005915.1/.p1  ORF type:complete len:541 (-),score=72.29 gb/GEZN01005915.1/:29-1651(-)
MADDSFNDDYNDAGAMSDDSFNADPGDDYDEDGFGTDFVPESKVEFEVWDQKRARQEMEAMVTDVSETINTDPEISSHLLRHFKWSREKLQSAFFENSKKILEQCGLHMFGVKPKNPGPGDVTCSICYDENPPEDSFALGCSHWYCKDCWAGFLVDKVESGKSCIESTCPGYKCPLRITDQVFELFLKDNEKVLVKYQEYVVRSFVEDNRIMKWCPAPRCEFIIKGSAAVKTVQCRCGGKFCFNCGEEAHAPAICSKLSLWLDKCRNESETAHWIIAHTKKCPKCLVRIEKNQGCNHITCRSCKHEFCWVCDGDWLLHGNTTGGFYKCNRYDPKQLKGTGKKGDVKDSREEAKRELDRYLFYYQRYHNHDQAKVFAAKALVLTEERMKLLQSEQTSWVDVQYLRAATEQVLECRRVLKFTYVFAYYLENGSEKTLFEYLQQDLERATEKLSELSEEEPEKIKRDEVVNYTRVTQKFLTNLLEGVENGLTGNPPELQAEMAAAAAVAADPSAASATSAAAASAAAVSTRSKTSAAVRSTKK